MALENPALSLSVKVQDILYILEGILKERNWTKFDLANLKLTYIPYYIFNYDILVEDSQGSQGTSGVMAIDAVSGKLEPALVDITERQPLVYEKEISHDIQYDLQQVAITKDELKETAKLKLAGQLGLKKENIAISGIRLVYWPIWIIFVELPGMIQKVQVDGVAGMPMNIEEVPERQKGWIEVTADTLQKLKSPSGWSQLSGTAIRAAGGKLKGGASKAKENVAGSGDATHATLKWLFTTKIGLYSLLLLAILVLFVVLSMSNSIPKVIG